MIMMIITMIMTSKMNLFDGERCLMTGRLEHSRGGISTSRLLPSGVCFHQETGSIKKQLSSGDCFHRETVFTGRLFPSGDFFYQDRFHQETGSIGRLLPLGATSIKTGSISKSFAEAGSIWTLHQHGSVGKASIKTVPCIGRGSIKTGSISRSSVNSGPVWRGSTCTSVQVSSQQTPISTQTLSVTLQNG